MQPSIRNLGVHFARPPTHGVSLGLDASLALAEAREGCGECLTQVPERRLYLTN